MEARRWTPAPGLLAAEVRAKAEADRRLKDANQVVETFLAAVSDDLRQVQGAQVVRRRLLQQAADYFARVAAERSGAPELEYKRSAGPTGAARSAGCSARSRKRSPGTTTPPDAARTSCVPPRIRPRTSSCWPARRWSWRQHGELGRADEAEAAYRRSVDSTVGAGRQAG